MHNLPSERGKGNYGISGLITPIILLEFANLTEEGVSLTVDAAESWKGATWRACLRRTPLSRRASGTLGISKLNIWSSLEIYICDV